MKKTLTLSVISIITFLSVTMPTMTLAEVHPLIARLDNGMDIVLVENHSVPMIAANIIIKVGSRDETWDTWGAAHFLEHLLFNGTDNRSQDEIYAEFDRIGAYHNAHTGSHFTDFMLLSARDNFTAGFEILSDMVFNSNLPPWKFEKERGIVIEEISRSQMSGPGAGELFNEALYGNSPLARPVLGTVESISNLDRDSVLTFYKRWYLPNNMFLFVTGDFKADTLFDWFQNYLSRYRPHEMSPRRHIDPPDFEQLSGLGSVKRFGDFTKQTLLIAVDAPMPGDPDFVPFLILQSELNDRLETELPPGTSGSGSLSLDPDVSVFQIHLTSPPDGPNYHDILAKLDQTIRDLVSHPPNSAEISRYARSYYADKVFNSERLHFYGIMYSQYWGMMDWDEFDSWTDRMANTTPGDLSRTAEKWLLNTDRFEMVIRPTVDSTEKDTIEISSLVKRFDPESGPTIIVRTDPSARVFAVHVTAKDRWLWDREYGTGSVDLLHRLLTEPYGKERKILLEQLDDLGAKLKCADNPYIPYDDYYSSPDFSFIRLEILPDKWRDGIKTLVNLMSTLPSSSDALTSALEKTNSSVSSLKNSPIKSGRKIILDKLIPGTPLSASIYGDVSSIQMKDIEGLRRSYFNPRNLIVTIAGPVDQDQVGEMVLKEFVKLDISTFTAPSQPEEMNTVPTPLLSWRDSLSLGKAQGAVLMGKVISQIDPEDRIPLTIANSYLNERLAMVLREQRGLAYSLGSSISFRRTDSDQLWGLWEISIGTRPENLQQAEEGIFEVIEEVIQHDFHSDEAERIANAISGRLMMRSMSRIGQAYSMGVGELIWNNPEMRNEFSSRLKLTTPQEIQQATRKYLSPDGLNILTVK